MIFCMLGRAAQPDLGVVPYHALDRGQNGLQSTVHEDLNPKMTQLRSTPGGYPLILWVCNLLIPSISVSPRFLESVHTRL